MGSAIGGFIAKYFINGSLAWRLKIDGASNEYVNAIACNTAGDLVVSIPFNSAFVTIYDRNNLAVASYARVSSWSGLLAHFSNNGTMKWAVRVSGSTFVGFIFDFFTSVSFGPRNEIIVGGSFQSTIACFFSPSGQNLKNISSAGLTDSFVAKYSRNGSLIWVTQIGSSDHEYNSYASVDSAGNVVFFGDKAGASSTNVFDSQGNIITISNTAWGVLLLKLFGNNGSMSWYSKVVPGTSFERANAITTDRFNNILVCGSFPTPTVPIDDSAASNLATLSNFGLNAGYLIKYDTHGRFVWAISFDGADDDRCNTVVVDNQDNIIITGQSNSYALAIRNSNSQNQVLRVLQSLGITTFVVKYDNDGNFIWASTVDGQIDEAPLTVSLDSSCNIYLGGTTMSPSISMYDSREKLISSITTSTNGDTWFGKLSHNGSTYGEQVFTTTASIKTGLTLGLIVAEESHTFSSRNFESTYVDGVSDSAGFWNNSLVLVAAFTGLIVALAIGVGLLYVAKRHFLQARPTSVKTEAFIAQEATTLTYSMQKATTIMSNHLAHQRDKT